MHTTARTTRACACGSEEVCIGVIPCALVFRDHVLSLHAVPAVQAHRTARQQRAAENRAAQHARTTLLATGTRETSPVAADAAPSSPTQHRPTIRFDSALAELHAEAVDAAVAADGTPAARAFLRARKSLRAPLRPPAAETDDESDDDESSHAGRGLWARTKPVLSALRRARAASGAAATGALVTEWGALVATLEAGDTAGLRGLLTDPLHGGSGAGAPAWRVTAVATEPSVVLKVPRAAHAAATAATPLVRSAPLRSLLFRLFAVSVDARQATATRTRQPELAQRTGAPFHLSFFPLPSFICRRAG